LVRWQQISFGKSEKMTRQPCQETARRANHQAEPFDPRRGNSRFCSLKLYPDPASFFWNVSSLERRVSLRRGMIA
jgi:hypothetical protein